MRFFAGVTGLVLAQFTAIGVLESFAGSASPGVVLLVSLVSAAVVGASVWTALAQLTRASSGRQTQV